MLNAKTKLVGVSKFRVLAFSIQHLTFFPTPLLYGKIKRRAGELVAFVCMAWSIKAFFTQFARMDNDVACCTPPSPRRIFPIPAGFPRECILSDQQTGPLMTTSLP